MDSSGRFTVLNNDADNIYISKSLLNKITAANQPQSASSNKETTTESQKTRDQKQPDFSSGEFLRGGTGAAYAQFNQPSAFPENAHSMPASIDPEYITKHASFDSGTHLFALRGEYERKLQNYQQNWRARFDELEHLNEQLFKLNSEKFAKEVSKVDERYFKKHSNYVVPCKEPESTVLQCLTGNLKKPLLCAEEVRQFSACVEKTRLEALKQ